jgi:hypothetical protein
MILSIHVVQSVENALLIRQRATFAPAHSTIRLREVNAPTCSVLVIVGMSTTLPLTVVP